MLNEIVVATEMLKTLKETHTYFSLIKPSFQDVMNYDCYLHENTRDRPEIHDIVARWKEIILEYSTSGQER